MRKVNIDIPLESPQFLVPYLASDNDYEHYEITKIKGALTNVIYKLSIWKKNSTNVNYLVRIFGAKLDSLVNRNEELKNIARVPKTVGSVQILITFNNGRVETFLEGYRSVTQLEMHSQQIYSQIARNFKRLHNLIEISKDEKHANQNGLCWDKVEDWMHLIETVDNGNWINNNNFANVKNIIHCRDWGTFKLAINKYKRWLLEMDSESFQTMAFCHNDAQHGNILIEDITCKTPNPTIKFIDYEYSGVNTIAFDLSNFLTECMHNYDASSKESYKCDGRKYPNDENILRFLSIYLLHLRDEEIIDPKELFQLYNSIIKWRAASQLFWALWAILQSGKLFVSSNENLFDSDHNSDEYDTATLSSLSNISDDLNDDGAETFDYMGFCKDKLAYFWGDLCNFGIATKDDCILSNIKFLETNLL